MGKFRRMKSETCTKPGALGGFREPQTSARTVVFLLALCAGLAGCKQSDRHEFRTTGTDWPSYQGDVYRNQYSPLDEINTANVGQLQLAWQYSTGDDVSGNRTQIQCNPLVLEGIVYGTSPKLRLFALEAATGRELWTFDPGANVNYSMNVNRGLVYWSDGGDRRIFYGVGPNLYAVNADTGYPVQGFGEFGRISLKEGLPEGAQDLYLAATSPGVVYRDLLIIGSRVSEGSDAAPGYIRAFDVRTGALAWVFRTIPLPGEYGHETWPPDAYRRAGGANSWAGMSLDPERGVVYVPTGSAAFDFWGGNRVGENLFANCVLALDAATGRRLWHYQTVRHDIWDRDLPAPPNLVTVEHDGKRIDAVAQITKSGHVFLLDRDTGAPLFPVEERPFPASDLEGEVTWPSQPIPVKPPPFARQELRPEDLTDISPEARQYAAGILANVRSGGQFVPPSLEGTVIFPGFDGGGEWGGAAFDQATGILYVNSNEMPWILTMMVIRPDEVDAVLSSGELVYRAYCALCHGRDMQGDPTGTYPSLVGVGERLARADMLIQLNTGKGFMPSFGHLSDSDKNAVLDYISGIVPVGNAHELVMESNRSTVPFTHTGYNRFLDPNGYPAVKPPWGTLSAIDLNKGEIRWQVPLGELEELSARGIPKTGTENYGGPVVTAGGLIFIGASKDEYFRAFDKETGEELWKFKLPAGGYATPSVYEAGGKQYVVIACGGGKMGTKSGESYLAFCLP
jgi:quinoprotein glucose dehydrogenase